MTPFQRSNPLTVLITLLSLTLPLMLCLDPALMAIGAVCMPMLLLRLCPERHRGMGLLALVALSVALFSPLFSRTGQTVLLVIADRPLTLEALLYGLASGVNLFLLLGLFRLLSLALTSDRVLYLCSMLSPSVALLFSVALRSMHLLGRQYRAVITAQKALNRYDNTSLPASVVSHARCFSILTAWALEQGLTTADSMDARGFGLGKRTAYRPYSLRRSDRICLILHPLLLALTLTALLSGDLGMPFYPTLSPLPLTPLRLVGLSSYLALSLSAILLGESAR